MIKTALKHIIYQKCIDILFDNIRKNFYHAVSDEKILYGVDITNEHHGARVKYLTGTNGQRTKLLRKTYITCVGDIPKMYRTDIGIMIHNIKTFMGGIILYD